MAHPESFYTQNGYTRISHSQITTAMEDYLEMIYRIGQKEQVVRIGKLAQYLHVKPSSASKMATNLKNQGMVEFERYGIILLTEKGRALGDYLMERHEILQRFFCYINKTQDELELVERVEHFIDERTVKNMKNFLEQVSK